MKTVARFPRNAAVSNDTGGNDHVREGAIAVVDVVVVIVCVVVDFEMFSAARSASFKPPPTPLTTSSPSLSSSPPLSPATMAARTSGGADAKMCALINCCNTPLKAPSASVKTKELHIDRVRFGMREVH
jgi:hypothetical protein